MNIRLREPSILEAYLQGALRDGTFNTLHKTHRFSQREKEWLELLQQILAFLGFKSWLYAEGKMRAMWALETSAPFLSIQYDASALVGTNEGLAYVRGYFDAEGGMPKSPYARLYFQMCQKDLANLQVTKLILESWDIKCGRIHNPSVAVDPNYWRYFVRANSHRRFMRLVGSWHPRKSLLINKRQAA